MLGRLRQSLKKIDMFSTTQFLRYKGETEYATLTGSCLSIGIVAVIIYLVFQVLLNTINKDKVTWSQTIVKQVMPSNTTIKMKEFKFGVNLFGHDLNDPSISYFDVTAEMSLVANGSFHSAQQISLSPCRLDDWSDSDQAEQVFTNNRGEKWLCPDSSQEVEIGGSWTSSFQQSIAIFFHPCGSYYTNKTNCATDAQMTQLFLNSGGTLFFVLMTINPLLQPGQLDPISQYVEDQILSALHQNSGQVVTIQVADYEMQTDHSLLPFSSIETASGNVVLDSIQTYEDVRSTNSSWYGGIIIRKSSSKLEYSRQFNKIDETVSYAGGLIGVVVGLFFVMAPYTQLCFELSLANRLFTDDEGEPVKNSFNFFKFMKYCLYALFSCCECLKWPDYDLYNRCSEQVQKELDIAYLLRRISTIQRVMSQTPELKQAFKDGYKKLKFEESDAKYTTVDDDPPDEGTGTQRQSRAKDVLVLNGESQVQMHHVGNYSLEQQQSDSRDDPGLGMAPVIVRPHSGSSQEREPAEQEGKKRRGQRRNKRRPQSVKGTRVADATQKPMEESNPATYQL